MSASEWHAMQEKVYELEYHLENLLDICDENDLQGYSKYQEAKKFHDELNEVEDE